MPRIVQSYIEKYYKNSTKVYLFCTSGGSGIERSIKDLKMLYPHLNIVSGNRLFGSDKSEIQLWIDSLK